MAILISYIAGETSKDAISILDKDIGKTFPTMPSALAYLNDNFGTSTNVSDWSSSGGGCIFTSQEDSTGSTIDYAVRISYVDQHDFTDQELSKLGIHKI